MERSEIDGILAFLRGAERLKDTHRSAWTSGGRREDAAAHTWRLCLMALLVHDAFPDVELGRLLAMCVVHDLGEAIGGDIPAIEQAPGESKAAQERADLLELLAPLPARLRARVTELWDEYEAATSPEAKAAKALDKLETILQHVQGANPPDFDYAFNLGYGRSHTAGNPVIEAMREVLDRATEARARGQG